MPGLLYPIAHKPMLGKGSILLDRFDPTQLLGNGLNASNILLANLGVNGAGSRHLTSYESHNLFVGTLYDHGIIGVSLLTMVFITLFVSFIRGMRKTNGTHRVLFLTALAILVSVCLQSLDAVDILFLNIGLYFWVIMALPFALCWSRQEDLSDDVADVERTIGDVSENGTPDGSYSFVGRSERN